MEGCPHAFGFGVIVVAGETWRVFAVIFCRLDIFCFVFFFLEILVAPELRVAEQRVGSVTARSG
jgi:hypothetical protein